MTRVNASISRRTLMTAAATVTAFGSQPARGQKGPVTQERESSGIRVRMIFGDREMIADLCENATANDFVSMLPLDLTIEDFGGNEKIAHLPRKLTEEGSAPFGDERPYDLFYCVPWGNLALFYADYRNPGLIRIGRF